MKDFAHELLRANNLCNCISKEFKTSQKNISFKIFPPEFYQSLPNFTPSSLRAKAKGTVLLEAAAQALNFRHPLNPLSGVYVCTNFGPTLQQSLRGLNEKSENDAIQTLRKIVPPKHYFSQSMSMKAGSLSLELNLHGPWLAITSAEHAFQQAWDLAKTDLIDGTVPAALICVPFMLEDEIIADSLEPLGADFVETCAVFYLEHPNSPPPPFTSGKFGPLTGVVEHYES